MKRREFLRSTLAGAVGAAIGGSFLLSAMEPATGLTVQAIRDMQHKFIGGYMYSDELLNWYVFAQPGTKEAIEAMPGAASVNVEYRTRVV